MTCPERIAVAAALLVLTCAAPALAAGRAPARLSADRRPANVDAACGSGNLGTWQTDAFGLPSYRYDADERSDPRAQQPELAGGTDAQHQVGNDHIVAAAFNHGYTQLWSQDRLMQWANRYEPDTRHFAGGYGYLVVDGAVASTLWLDHAAGPLERDFGIGYSRRALGTGGVEVEQITDTEA